MVTHFKIFKLVVDSGRDSQADLIKQESNGRQAIRKSKILQLMLTTSKHLLLLPSVIFAVLYYDNMSFGH